METSRFVMILEDTARRHGLSGATLLVGVSGGADSLALLHGLAQAAEPLALRLVVAHFDHQLRTESAADARFVEDFGRSLGLPVRVGSADVRGLARQRGMGIEEAARQARLRFFVELIGETGAAAVAVGHTRDDQVETRLLHLVRGAGLRGLVGMQEDANLVVEGQVLRVFRPILGVGRADTQAYCAAVGLQSRDDRTNRDLAFARNRIRHAIVPPMQLLNPRVDDALERLGRAARAADDFVEAELDRRFPEIVQTGEAGWLVRRHVFRDLPEALKRALLRRAAQAVGAEVGAESIESALAAAESWPAGTRLTWPNNTIVRIEHDWLSIGRGVASERTEESLPSVEVPVVGGDMRLVLPWALSRGERPVEALLRVRRRGLRCRRPRDRWHADFDAERIAGPLVVRRRHPGDRLASEGLTGTKKLQDLLVDAHIPRVERDLIPLLTTCDTVAWVVGLRRNRELLAGADCHDVICCDVVETAGDTNREI